MTKRKEKHTIPIYHPSPRFKARILTHTGDGNVTETIEIHLRRLLDFLFHPIHGRRTYLRVGDRNEVSPSRSETVRTKAAAYKLKSASRRAQRRRRPASSESPSVGIVGDAGPEKAVTATNFPQSKGLVSPIAETISSGDVTSCRSTFAKEDPDKRRRGVFGGSSFFRPPPYVIVPL